MVIICIVLMFHFFIHRHPRVAIELETGHIYVGQCDCRQNRCGQCSHVAATLFMLEEYKHPETKPRIDPVCTSKGQGWGKLLFIKYHKICKCHST